MAKTTTAKKSMSWLKKTIIMSLLAAVLLLVANSAVWVNQNIFNSENFAKTATQSITSESSRTAIAQGITDELLATTPVAKNLLGDSITSLLSGILSTDQLSDVVSTVATRSNAYLTSKNQESIEIDLSGVKGFMSQVVDVVGNFREVKLDPSKIPDQIVLVNADDVPNLYNYSLATLWLGPIALLGSLALFAYPYVKNRKEYKTILILQGAFLSIVGLLALLIGPLFKPIVMSNIEGTSAKVVVSNLYNAFSQTYINQTGFVIGVGVVMILSGTGLVMYKRLKK